jgi:hypothetical protein
MKRLSVKLNDLFSGFFNLWIDPQVKISHENVFLNIADQFERFTTSIHEYFFYPTSPFGLCIYIIRKTLNIMLFPFFNIIDIDGII